MSKWFKKFFVMVITLFFVVIDTVSIYKGSAPYSETNIAQTGGSMALSSENSLKMEKTVLMFDIEEFPLLYYKTEEELLSYGGKVTAEYTLYNPTDKKIATTFVSPIGLSPLHAYQYKGQSMATEDVDQYDITIDGKTINKKVRHTWFSQANQLDVKVDVPRLKNEYAENSFYTRDMPIVYRSYQVRGVNKRLSYGQTTLSFKWNGNEGKSKIFLNEFVSTEVIDGDTYVNKWVSNGEIITIGFIGAPPQEELEFEIYEKGDRERKSKATITPIDVQETYPTDFEELVFQKYDVSKGVSKIDWYNAYVDYLNAQEQEKGVLSGYIRNVELFDMLFRWYEYEITLEPGQRVVNTVTSPIYPERNATYKEGVYNYLYTWSTLRTWEGLEDIEIRIHTPFYLLERNTAAVDQGFCKMETGYCLSLDALSEETVEEMFYFVLSKEESPRIPLIREEHFLMLFGGVLLLIICALPVGFVIGIVFLIRYWWKLRQ